MTPRFHRTTRRCLIFLSIALTVFALGCSTRKPGSHQPSYRGARLIRLAQIRFDDGDTFFVNDKAVRVLGIDTPEVAHPALGIHEGQPFGDVAAESTRVWMSRANVIEYVPGGRDLYNRRLAHVFLDGQLLSILLIQEGLAYETVSHYGDSGFPDLAQQILDASRVAPKPQFEEPYKWKRKQREKSRRENP